jgi:hypothetical protein
MQSVGQLSDRLTGRVKLLSDLYHNLLDFSDFNKTFFKNAGQLTTGQ